MLWITTNANQPGTYCQHNCLCKFVPFGQSANDDSCNNNFFHFQTSGIPFSNTVVSTGITPVFTPTSFANLEQTIASLTQQQVNTNVAVSRESGFVPPSIISEASVTPPMPVMVQVKSEVDYDTDQSSLGSESDYGASSAKRARFSERSAKITIPDIDPTTYLVSNSRRPTGPRRIKKDENVSYIILYIMTCYFLTCRHCLVQYVSLLYSQNIAQ